MTKLYIKCVTHEPALISNTVGTLADLEQLRHYIQHSEDIAHAVNDLKFPVNDPTERAEALRFISMHPHCDKEIWDVEGQKIPLTLETGTEERRPFGHKQTPIGLVKAVLFTNDGLTIEFESLNQMGRDLLNLNFTSEDFPKENTHDG